MKPIRTWIVAGSTLAVAAFAACTTFERPPDAPAGDAGTVLPDGAVVLQEASVLTPAPPPFDGSVPFTMTTPTDPVVAVRGRSPGVVDVKVEPVIKGEVTLDGLPTGVTAKAVTLDNQGAAKLTIDVPAGTRSGTFEVTVRAKQLAAPSTASAKVKLEIRGASGEVDETFAGYLKPIPATSPMTYVSVASLLPLEDGSLLLSDTKVLRKLRVDGTPDTTFGNQGIVAIANETAGRLLKSGASVFATFTAADGVRCYAVDPSTGATTLSYLLPTAEIAGAALTIWTTLAPPSTLVIGGAKGANWFATAFDAATQSPATWGNAGSIAGTTNAPPAFAFFTGTQDDLFARRPSGADHVVLSKQGGVLSTTSLDFGSPFQVAGIAKIGEGKFVIAQGSGGLQLLSIADGQVSALGPVYSGAFGGSVAQTNFHALPDGFVAIGVRSGTLGVLVVRTDRQGLPYPGFGASGEVIVGGSPGSDVLPSGTQQTALTADKLKLMVATTGGGLSTSFYLTRIWL